MKQVIYTVSENRKIADSVFLMKLQGDVTAVTGPGQFVNVSVPGLFLRRPISVCDCAGDALTLIYKVVGKGTEAMGEMAAGEKLSVLTGLGNGYDLTRAGDRPLLLGGGVGVPPLYLLAKELKKAGKEVSVVLGFNTKTEVFFEKEFKALGCDVTVTTVDGSYGVKGFVTDALPENYTYFYTCGPLPMLKSVYRTAKTSGEFSLEERMGCGFGACMGCSIKVKDLSEGGVGSSGSAAESGAENAEVKVIFKRICKEGPVFKKEELLWED